MESMPKGWKPRHVEALRAWERGDVHRLIQLCHREIEVEAKKQAAHCYGAVSEDEFAQEGRRAVGEGWKKYDPKRDVPFQVYIDWRIRGAMKDLMSESFRLEHEQRYFAYQAAWQSLGSYESEGAIPPYKHVHKSIHEGLLDLLGEGVEHDRQQKGVGDSLDPEEALDELGWWVEEGERDISAVLESFKEAIDRIALEDWRHVIEANSEVARFLWALLGEAGYEQLTRRQQKVLRLATKEHFRKNVFEAAPKARTSFTDLSEPLLMAILERQRKTLDPSYEPKARELSRVFGASDKTITEWKKRMNEAGPPPLLREDGSFKLRNQEDRDKWADYWVRIADPRVWRRLHRQKQAE